MRRKLKHALFATYSAVVTVECRADDIRLDGLGMRLVKIRLEDSSAGANFFFMQETEVTNEQFRVYLMESGNLKGNTTDFVEHADEAREIQWSENDFPVGKANHPVVLVSPAECEGFCNWLTKRNPLLIGSFRLPTKKEWIWSAYGSERQFPWGIEFRERALRAPHQRGSLRLGVDFPWDTNAVKAYAEGMTPEGLYGMWGNVSEMVAVLRGEENEWRAQPYWMGGGFMYDKDYKASQDYWGFADNQEHKGIDIGFRVVFIPKRE